MPDAIPTYAEQHGQDGRADSSDAGIEAGWNACRAMALPIIEKRNEEQEYAADLLAISARENREQQAEIGRLRGALGEIVELDATATGYDELEEALQLAYEALAEKP